MKVLGLLLLMVTCWTWPAKLSAHGLNVGQLSVYETAPSTFQVSVRFPDFSLAPERVALLSPGCTATDQEPSAGDQQDRLVLDGTFSCLQDPATEVKLTFPWPNSTVYAVVERFDGRETEQFLNAADGVIELDLTAPVENVSTAAGSASFYGRMGFFHILGGWDHLLFVACLLIIVPGWRALLVTITAFTLGHSLTLALAVLGYVNVRSATVELVIALSVVFLAAEVLRAGSLRKSLTLRAPWLVALFFGLLHGLGFAGALGEIGLPPDQVPVSLLFFNLGVEAGQILFAFFLLAALWLVRKWRVSLAGRAEYSIAVVAGVAGSYWVFQRGSVMLQSFS